MNNILDGYGHRFWWLMFNLFFYRRDKLPPTWLTDLCLGEKGRKQAMEIADRVYEELIANPPPEGSE